MKTYKHRCISLFGVLLVSTITVYFAGCAAKNSVTNESSKMTISSANSSEDIIVSAGAQLWAENCIRCHNYRTPASLSDREWRIVLHHMRVRANLTTQEHDAILSFLQASN